MSASTLKILALLTMVIDHVGAVFFPDEIWLRMIGRFSFPIFMFMLVQGFVKTRSRLNYGLRLAIFAVISELPYDLLFYGSPFNLQNQNIFFELLAALIMLQLVESGIKKKRPLYFVGAVLIMAVALLGNFSYGLYGMALALAFYFLRGTRLGPPVALVALTWLFNGVAWVGIPLWGNTFYLLEHNPPQLFAVAAAGLLPFYNGQKGTMPMKSLYYVAYPLHLILLYGIDFFFRQ